MVGGQVAPEYVAARRALLDVLELLEAQRHGLVIVGAQAVYLRAPAGRTGELTHTTDGDLALDPDLLTETPDIGALLATAGYRAGPNPGAFVSPGGIAIDLMVPAGALPASSRRTALLNGQSANTARRTVGLELALLDSSVMVVGALEPGDRRALDAKVAGAAALAVAKLTKIEERTSAGRRDRILSKDAGDLLRLLRYCDAESIGHQLRILAKDARAAPVIARATEFLRDDLASRGSVLVALAIEAKSGDETERQIATALRTLGSRVLKG
jgi:hypothetical protein